jgi:hypothetical protein
LTAQGFDIIFPSQVILQAAFELHTLATFFPEPMMQLVSCLRCSTAQRQVPGAPSCDFKHLTGVAFLHCHLLVGFAATGTQQNRKSEGTLATLLKAQDPASSVARCAQSNDSAHVFHDTPFISLSAGPQKVHGLVVMIQTLVRSSFCSPAV